MKLINLSGRRFGRLTVIERSGSDKRREAMWLCQCSCGDTSVALGSNLRTGHTKSCGCLNAEMSGQRGKAQLTTHGLSSRRAHKSWFSAKSRCENKNNPAYDYYGGRGIKMCDRWSNSVAAFIEDMGERPVGYSIERIDVNGDYEPGNCCWIPWIDQFKNKRPFPLGISGVRGVYKNRNKWRSVLLENGKKINVGSFNTVDEAKRAVEQARDELNEREDNGKE